MVDTLFIKSKSGNYIVNFDNTEDVLNKLFRNRAVLVVDRNLYDNYDIFKRRLSITIDALETSKDYRSVASYIDALLDLGFKRNWKLVAVGGGIIQDITGFIASILYRGVEWHYFPTTFLSMADSCIGGKSSINMGQLKNQVGTFYPPKSICIDISFLDTLPKHHMLSGYGEVYKYHILDGNYKVDSMDIKSLIRYCLNVKKQYIEEDEFDTDKRNLLNYGHTFGHAIEASTDFKFSHGTCVAVGMDIANFISHRMKWMSDEKYNKVSGFLNEILYKDNFIPDIDRFMDCLKQDKKMLSDKIRIVVLTNNSIRIEEMPEHSIKRLVGEYIQNMRVGK